MTYPYIGPELARLKKIRSKEERDRDTYARRANLSKILTLGSAAVFATSLAGNFELVTNLWANGPMFFEPGNPLGIGVVALTLVPTFSFVGGVASGISWRVNAHNVKERNENIAWISEDIREIEKGKLQ